VVLDYMIDLLPAFSVFVAGILLSYLVDRVINAQMEGSGKRSMIKGVVHSVMILFGLVLVVVLLPVSAQTKENLLQVGGLLLTGLVAFSSTTVMKDAAAGVAMQFFGAFRRGDYLETNEYFGRISDIGILHTELQTQDRSLVTLANGTLLNQTFKTIPSSGTIISTTVSLGYDVSRAEIEDVLIDAAEDMGLKNPFVHVLELGNFAITYKVAGLLEDVENLLTVRSDFRKTVLDHLHENRIEIVSPNFVNRRDVSEQQFIPKTVSRPAGSENGGETEEVIFEKALEAKKVEDLDQLVDELNDQISELKESDADQAARRIEEIERRIEAIEKRRDQLEEQIDEETE
jgi:small conductance mechanosensitive channel